MDTSAPKKRDATTGTKTATAHNVPLYPDALLRLAGMRALARTAAPNRKEQWRYFFTTADRVPLDDPTAALTAPVWDTARDDAPLSLLKP